MAWELPFAYQHGAIIWRHSNQIRSLSLMVNHYNHMVNGDSFWFGLRARLRSLQHIYTPNYNESTIPIYLQILSGLQLEKVTVEIDISRRIDGWLTETSIWEHITTLIIDASGHSLKIDSTRKPSMPGLKSLTIQDCPKLLVYVTLPRLTYLSISSQARYTLSAQDIPPKIETLKTQNIEIRVDDVHAAKLFRNLLVFEGVDSQIGWFTDTRFSLPRVRSLYLERVRIHNREVWSVPLDVPFALSHHKSIGSITSLDLLNMAITPSTVNPSKSSVAGSHLQSKDPILRTTYSPACDACSFHTSGKTHSQAFEFYVLAVSNRRPRNHRPRMTN